MKKLIPILIVLMLVASPVDALTKKKVIAPKIDPMVALQAKYEARITALEEQIATLEANISSLQVAPAANDNIITADDIAPYLPDVAPVICLDAAGNSTGGTGIFMSDSSGKWYILSNGHVLNGNTCVTSKREYNDFGTVGFMINSNIGVRWNTLSDINEAPITGDTSVLDNNAGTLRTCKPSEPLGTPVALIGYPSSGYDGSTPRRIVTTGVISGINYNSSTGLPHINYFISAKADHGNSGGLAIAKDNLGLCELGVLTWVNIGTADNMGVIQNMSNVLWVN